MLDVHIRSVLNNERDQIILEAPYAVEVNNNGDIFVADTANNRVIKFIDGDFDKPVYYPDRGETDETGDVEVVTGIDQESVDENVLAQARVDSDRRLFKPMGLTFYEEFIYIADSGNGRVVVLRDDGDTLSYMRSFGYFVELGVLRDIKYDGNGNFYLLDSRYGRIMKYDYLGNHIAFSEDEPDITGLFNPYGLTVDVDGNIYVADTTHHKVVKYSPEGEKLLEFGEQGKGEGKLFYPQDVAIDNEGSIFVADTENYRVMKFDDEGAYVGYFGSWGREPGQFFHNRKISFGLKDGQLLLYAVDTSLWRVVVIEVTPFIVIEHKHIEIISSNPFPVTADVTTELAEAIGLTFKHKINEGQWLYATIAEDGTLHYSQDVTGAIFEAKNGK